MRVSRGKRARCVQLENCLSTRLACCFYKPPPTDCRHSIQNTTCCKRTCNPKQNFQLRAAHAPRQGKFYGKGRRHMQFSQYTNHKLFRIANFPCRERLPAVAKWQGCAARMFDTPPLTTNRLGGCSSASFQFGCMANAARAVFSFARKGRSGISTKIA